MREGEVGYSGTAEPCDMTQMHWCWRERKRERRGMGGEEEGCEITLLFYLFLTRAHECSHTHLHTHTAGDATIAASKWLHINIQWKQRPQLPVILLLKTNGISSTRSSHLAPAALKVVTCPRQLTHTQNDSESIQHLNINSQNLPFFCLSPSYSWCHLTAKSY